MVVGMCTNEGAVLSDYIAMLGSADESQSVLV